jgi:ribosomal protein S18 acetylase RimI-like enzyme
VEALSVGAITVRRVGADEARRVAPLYDAYRQFYQRRSDLELAERFLTERLERDESVVLLAERDGAAVGFTQLYPLFSSIRCERVYLLNDLYVDASARRLGVAAALLTAAADFARAAGASYLTLETANDNLPAQRLYERLGWRHVSEFRAYQIEL